MTNTIRLLHRYLGLFFAPVIVFFAFSGALQTFGWHETSHGSHRPPEWLVKMAQLHKKQTFNVPPPKIREKKDDKGELKPIVADESPVVPGKNPDGDKTRSALKYFVFVMSIAFILTTILGVVMALRYRGNPRVVWTVILIGTLFPVAVMLL